MPVKVGLCGFTIGAAAYYRTFRVLEVQQTFYDPPPVSTLERWRSQAPGDFEFTMKAWQVITHFGTSRTYRRLKSPFSDRERSEAGGFRLTPTVMRAWEKSLSAARTLRATAILFQCPASFKATEENVANMKKFFSEIERPEGLRFLWEPRGPWPDETVLDVCRTSDLVHTVDPFIRPALTSAPTYWRLHGNKSHYATYDDAELAQIRAWLPADDETYVMFNNIPRVKDSKRFLEMI